MPITATYDKTADALYVRLAEGERHGAIEINPETYVDIAADGRALGLELLYPSMGLDLDAPLERFGLDALKPAVLAAIAVSGAPVSLPTATASTATLVQFSNTRYMIEGTIPAETTAPGVAATGMQPGDRVVCLDS